MSSSGSLHMIYILYKNFLVLIWCFCSCGWLFCTGIGTQAPSGSLNQTRTEESVPLQGNTTQLSCFRAITPKWGWSCLSESRKLGKEESVDLRLVIPELVWEGLERLLFCTTSFLTASQAWSGNPSSALKDYFLMVIPLILWESQKLSNTA